MGDETETASSTQAIADREQQFLDVLEHCPAGLNVVDEDGRLLFHNARIRELFGYSRDELHLFDTRRFWNDLHHRERIIEKLRHGGSVLNEEVIWKTKFGNTVPVLVSCPQVA